MFDAVDAVGRRYLEVRSLSPDLFKTFQLIGLQPEPCVECGASIHHGRDRYYQRNEADDGSQPDKVEALLNMMTYDAVCAACGDRALAKGAE